MTAFSLQSKWSPLSPGAGRDEHYLRYCPSPRVRLGPHSQGDPCPALQPARRGPRNRASGPGQRSVSVGQLWWGTARFRADKWDIRQHPNLHQIWAILLGTERLCVSLDSCRFTPPWKPGYAEPYGIHWDHDPRDTEKRMFQGVLALTDTGIDQGGFRCVPSLYSDRGSWPSEPTIDADGENWLADIAGREIAHVRAQAGDLIVWDSLLAHGNSKNLSSRPR